MQEIIMDFENQFRQLGRSIIKRSNSDQDIIREELRAGFKYFKKKFNNKSFFKKKITEEEVISVIQELGFADNPKSSKDVLERLVNTRLSYDPFGIVNDELQVIKHSYKDGKILYSAKYIVETPGIC